MYGEKHGFNDLFTFLSNLYLLVLLLQFRAIEGDQKNIVHDLHQQSM